jgi:DNA repair protein RecO (recombination protein O)
MSKIYSVEALVLRARDYGEADKILTLYTKEQGKVSAIAKGARKPKSRLRGGVQLFSHSRIVLYRGPSLDTVTLAETVQAFAPLREDLTFLSYASYLVELLDCAVPEREPHEGIFHLAINCLELFPEKDPELVARLF